LRVATLGGFWNPPNRGEGIKIAHDEYAGDIINAIGAVGEPAIPALLDIFNTGRYSLQRSVP